MTPNKNSLVVIFFVAAFLGVFSSGVPAQVLQVKGQLFTLNEKPFDMWGVRTASASQKEEYTQELIANLADYKASGINTLSVFLQGSSGGYSDPFEDDGKSIDPSHWERFTRIIEACAKQEMVVIAGIFYQRTLRDPEIRNLDSKAAIFNAVHTFTNKLKPYRNVIINIANEQNSTYYRAFKEFSFNNPQNIILLCREVKMMDPSRIVGGGGYNDSSNVTIGKSEFVDVLLFDTFGEDIENGHDSGWHYKYFKSEGVPEKPIVNVEIFGGWTGIFVPPGVYTKEGKDIHINEISAAVNQLGLFVHFHSNTWFQGAGQEFQNHYYLGGMGTSDDPGVRWYFEKINEVKFKANEDE